MVSSGDSGKALLLGPTRQRRIARFPCLRLKAGILLNRYGQNRVWNRQLASDLCHQRSFPSALRAQTMIHRRSLDGIRPSRRRKQ